MCRSQRDIHRCLVVFERAGAGGGDLRDILAWESLFAHDVCKNRIFSGMQSVEGIGCGGPASAAKPVTRPDRDRQGQE